MKLALHLSAVVLTLCLQAASGKQPTAVEKLPPASGVSGRVVTAADGTPLKSARVILEHMSQDQTFRSALIAILLLTLPIGVYHRLKSLSTSEKLDRRREGLFILATLRPVGIALWLGLIAWIVDPVWMSWSSVFLPTWLRWTGVGMIAIACGLLVWTLRCLGKNLTDTVVTRQQHTLIIHGPYRWVRHPFYDSAALLVVAVSLTAANWFLLVNGIVLFCLLIIRTRMEEQYLVARFGDSYTAYRERTGRFLPEFRTILGLLRK